MSTRTYMVSLRSLEPIQKAIGSKDQSLLDALTSEVGDDRQEFCDLVKKMIMGPLPAKEPGCWNYVIEPLAEHFGLAPITLPLDDWEHNYVWEEFRSIADPLISRRARRLLKWLDLGRPFHGTGIDYDGCLFAWLTADETKSLLGDLSIIDADKFGDLAQFHKELVASLKETVNGKNSLFLGAC